MEAEHVLVIVEVNSILRVPMLQGFKYGADAVTPQAIFRPRTESFDPVITLTVAMTAPRYLQTRETSTTSKPSRTSELFMLVHLPGGT
jgi:hypothetical protein